MLNVTDRKALCLAWNSTGRSRTSDSSKRRTLDGQYAQERGSSGRLKHPNIALVSFSSANFSLHPHAQWKFGLFAPWRWVGYAHNRCIIMVPLFFLSSYSELLDIEGFVWCFVSCFAALNNSHLLRS